MYNILISVISKAIHRLNTTAVKIPKVFISNIAKSILKFIQNLKGTQVSKTIWRKKVGGFMLLQNIILTLWFWNKHRHIDQYNRTSSPEINSCVCGQMVFDMGAKTIQWGKDSLLKNFAKTRCPHGKE